MPDKLTLQRLFRMRVITAPMPGWVRSHKLVTSSVKTVEPEVDPIGK